MQKSHTNTRYRLSVPPPLPSPPPPPSLLSFSPPSLFHARMEQHPLPASEGSNRVCSSTTVEWAKQAMFFYFLPPDLCAQLQTAYFDSLKDFLPRFLIWFGSVGRSNHFFSCRSFMSRDWSPVHWKLMVHPFYRHHLLLSFHSLLLDLIFHTKHPGPAPGLWI